MDQKIYEPASVGLICDHRKHTVYPKWVLWSGRRYDILRVGLHHTERVGRTLYHIFSVASRNLFFRLSLDTDTLAWKVLEVSSGF